MDLSPEHHRGEDEEEEGLKAQEDEEDDGRRRWEGTALWELEFRREGETRLHSQHSGSSLSRRVDVV